MKRGGGGGGGGGGEIVQVEGGHIIRSTGRKDRHSKVFTAKGPRDRRVRLSAHTAIQFYDVQDRLGYDRPSKAVDWLIKKAKNAIDKLAELPPWNPNDDVSIMPARQEGDVAAAGSSSGMPLEQNSDSSARYEFPFQKHLEAAGNAAGSSPFILQEDAETMKSFFPMNSGSSLMNFQSYGHDIMPPRASIQTEDLGLSLHTLQDHRRPASTSQIFSGGSNPATFEANFSRMVGWSGGGNGGESRVGFFLNHPHQSIPPPPPPPPSHPRRRRRRRRRCSRKAEHFLRGNPFSPTTRTYSLLGRRGQHYPPPFPIPISPLNSTFRLEFTAKMNTAPAAAALNIPPLLPTLTTETIIIYPSGHLSILAGEIKLSPKS